MSKTTGPRSRADCELSNLVLEGGKSRIARDAVSGKFVRVDSKASKVSERVSSKPTNKPGGKR